MNRAAILIGVQEPAILPELSAVWTGVEEMKNWGLAQGIECRSITDQLGPVSFQDIYDAVNEFADPEKRVQQLLVYFAGHGVNKNYGEYWLLSHAIEDPNAAINVEGSLKRAQYCCVPHVVLISDACRTAVNSIQAAGIVGGSIFASPKGRPAVDVDQFYATQLGEPAFEISDSPAATPKFTAIYTHVMLEALRGEHRDLAEWDGSLGKQVIRPRPLEQFLFSELPKRVYRLTAGANPRSQTPDAIIQSHEAWLSALSPPREPIPFPVKNPIRKQSPTRI